MLFSYKLLLYYSTVNHWLIVACIHHYTLLDHLNFLQLNKQLFRLIICLVFYCSFVAS
nr:MAG TPA: hypothetical protein [Caudoviricetes sp.]